jgi:hypothetical protein
VSQSDSASGAGLVFIAASAAAAACAAAAAAAAFLLAIQRKDKKELPADARSKTRGVIEFASGVCVCKVQHVK